MHHAAERYLSLPGPGERECVGQADTDAEASDGELQHCSASNTDAADRADPAKTNRFSVAARDKNAAPGYNKEPKY